MTDDDFEQLILFKLIDYNLTGAKYLAVDFDGEIVVSHGDRLVRGIHNTTNSYNKNTHHFIWRSNDAESVLTGTYLTRSPDDTPPNYKNVMIKL